MLVVDVPAAGEQVHQERARDVVGQVAHQPQPLRAVRRREGRVVEAQGVGHVQAQVPLVPAPAQARGQVAIDLDGVQVIDTLEQRRRERGEPRTDLDQDLPRTRMDRLDDRCHHRGVDEEMLPEALARHVAGDRPRGAHSSLYST